MTHPPPPGHFPPPPGAFPGLQPQAPFPGPPAYPGQPVAPPVFPGPPAAPSAFPGPPAAPPVFPGQPAAPSPFPGQPPAAFPAAFPHRPPAPFPGPPPGAPPPPAPAGPPGWWRRNRWGLLLLLPALLAALAGPYLTGGRVYLEDPTEPQHPVAVAADGWTSFADARIHLDKLTDLKNVTDRSRKPLTIGTAVVWQATVTYESAKTENEKLAGCTVLLEDSAGRRYGDRPSELSRADLPTGSGCGRPTTVGARTPSPSGPRYTANYFFLLPAGATAAAVWVTVPTESPSYARLPRP